MTVRVLLVDDSALIRDALRNHVECIGCSVVAEAENTSQALDLFRTINPDLVILDAAVSQTGGIGALALLRIMCNEITDLAVLVTSALALCDLRRSFNKEGALGFLCKPFNARTFEQIRKLLLERFPMLTQPDTFVATAAL
jgi:DNA-binding NarL/FixJ family response regulator